MVLSLLIFEFVETDCIENVSAQFSSDPGNEMNDKGLTNGLESFGEDR